METWRFVTHRDADQWTDVGTGNDIRGQERNVQIPRCNDFPGLCINLVNIILSSSDEDILYAIVERVYQRLRVDLLQSVLVVSWKRRCPELTELRAPHNRGIQIMITEI